ncbi:MAG: hypothetical protein LBQ44_09735, partial [Treponema sp.]|nr:hypothetical protein [Treponema sp.]
MFSRNVKILAEGEVSCVREELDRGGLKAGEALIRNEASLISTGTELSRVFGIKKGLVYPLYPGYASIGRVEESGPGTELQRGGRVLFSGAHREYQVFHSGGMSALNMLVKLGPQYDALSSVHASLLHLGLVAMNGILPADLKAGDKVCVFGLGVVGLITALLYQAAGAWVLGVDTEKSRAAHAGEAGLRNVLAAPAGQGTAGGVSPAAGAVKEFFGG